MEDVITTLILTISLHFIGDPSHLKDKNVELLSNLKCKKLSDFQKYKNTRRYYVSYNSVTEMTVVAAASAEEYLPNCQSNDDRDQVGSLERPR